MIRLVSVNVGAVVERRNARGRPARSGIGKQPVAGPVAVGVQGLAGDASAYRSRRLGDTAVHGFSVEAYRQLEALAGTTLPVPCFGENLTLAGYPETDARVGDVLRIGTAILHLNQPVVRCSWPGVIAARPQLLREMRQARVTGYYLDVLEPGTLEADAAVELCERGDPAHSVAALNAVLAGLPETAGEARALLVAPSLAARWKRNLREALDKAQGSPSGASGSK